MNIAELYALGEYYAETSGGKVDVYYSDIHQAVIITRLGDINQIFFASHVGFI